MRNDRPLQFQVHSGSRLSSLQFNIGQIICAGHSGRDVRSVRHHIDELLALGVAAPDRTPIFFKVSTYLATTDDDVTVQDRQTSGEVEFVLLFHNDATYLTCGSDHTHRWIERYSLEASKQMFPKVLAPDAWRLEDVENHWDQLEMRSWATIDGKRMLYQEGALGRILPPANLLDAAEDAFGGSRTNGTVFMSGTLPTLGGGFVYADHFSFELRDPVLNRTIAHAYDVSQLTERVAPSLAEHAGAAARVG